MNAQYSPQAIAFIDAIKNPSGDRITNAELLRALREIANSAPDSTIRGLQAIARHAVDKAEGGAA